MDAPLQRSGSGSGSTERVVPRLGGLRLLRRLGVGGMGAVWLGHDEALGVSRAVKVLPESAELELRLRFRREAEAMARVDDHPNVVRVHAAGEENGWAYLVMDLAPGGDLDHRLRQGPLPSPAVVDLGLALARALAHVHAKGVLHRDLKPANVLFDEGGAPRIVDFGLARLSGRDRLTQSGAIVGTPTHMAPEQALGLPVDVRTDVFGLGAVLYHALTGRAPVAEGPLTTVLTDVIERLPARPSALVPGVPPKLDAVIMRALAKSPDDRFDSAEELARALEPLVVGVGEGDADAPPPPRSMKPLVAAAVVSLVVAASALVLARPSGKSADDRPIGGGPRPPVSTATRPPPTSAPLPEDALRAALLDDDAAAGLALLGQTCPGDAVLTPEAATWAAALVLLSDDVDQAARWAARAPAGNSGQWLRAAARVAARAPRPGRMDEADAALWDLEDAMLRLDGWTVDIEPARVQDTIRNVTSLVRAAATVAKRGTGKPMELAAGIRAQRRLCALYPELIEMLYALMGYEDHLPPAMEALEAAIALAKESRPALGLQAVAACARGRVIPPTALCERVDALPTSGRYGWVHGVFSGAWLSCAAGQAPRPDDAHLEEVRRRWRTFEAFARGTGLLGADEPDVAAAVVRMKFLLIHASNWRSEALFRRACAVQGTPAESAAVAEALDAALDNPEHHHLFVRHQARLHLLTGDTEALGVLLTKSRHYSTSDWFCALQLERAIGAGDLDAMRVLLEDPSLATHGGVPLWRAVLAALEGDHARAEALLGTFTGDMDLLMIPWRTAAGTRRLLAAIRDGSWRPAGRPFVDLR